MHAVPRPPNRLLKILPAADFQSLCPHLEPVELAKGSVLIETGVPQQHIYLPHSGIVSMMVSLSEGQTVEVAMVGRDTIVGASAALDAGPALTDAIVVAPGTASVLKAGDLRAAADRSSTLRKHLARHQQTCWSKRSNRPPAMRLIRWKRACRGCYCAHGICAIAKACC